VRESPKRGRVDEIDLCGGSWGLVATRAWASDAPHTPRGAPGRCHCRGL